MIVLQSWRRRQAESLCDGSRGQRPRLRWLYNPCPVRAIQAGTARCARLNPFPSILVQPSQTMSTLVQPFGKKIKIPSRDHVPHPNSTLDSRCLTPSYSLRSAKVIQAYSSLFKVIQALKKIVIFFRHPGLAPQFNIHHPKFNISPAIFSPYLTPIHGYYRLFTPIQAPSPPQGVF
jgi:hypothetical protein